jgi:hypothetical protein
MNISQNLKRLRKGTKRLSHDGRSPDRDMKKGPYDYEASVLSISQRRSMTLSQLLPNNLPLSYGAALALPVYYIQILGARNTYLCATESNYYLAVCKC